MKWISLFLKFCIKKYDSVAYPFISFDYNLGTSIWKWRTAYSKTIFNLL